MQNNPTGFGSGGNNPPPSNSNPFASPPTRLFSFNLVSSPQTQQQKGPFLNNPFQKVNAAPTTLFGMNINPQTTTTTPSFSSSRPAFSFAQPTTSNQLFSSASDTRSQYRFTNKEANKLQAPPAQLSVFASKGNEYEETKHVAPQEATLSQSVKSESVQELPECEAKQESVTKQDQPSPEQKQLKRTSSTDISDLRTIIIHGIPEDSNNKLELTKLFQPFGNITRIFPNVKRGAANITFDCHDSAAKAKKSGSNLRPGVEFKILWRQAQPKERKTLGPSKTEVKAKPSKESEDPPKKMTAAPRKTNATFNLSEGLPMQMTEDELTSVLLQQARSASEKATILDARDRLVRIKKESKSKSASDVKSVATLKGTCPDMCPEKERYLRVEKRRLAPYEMANQDKDYDVDHRLAVKEYSRSSADQAEPLVHELRPLPVLEMTMDYLISSIMDRCDRPSENLAEWFNFLWDRTRGIRKDVTQQSLCDLGAVDLVEKCARFHIHCTARLCELDMQDFDQKINDENLTKCMQTLKHMYYDLSVKQIFCPNEAEFRAYDILLHLNVGDTLREVQQFREEVRESAKVRAALQFFNAVNSRNFVRFFRLAKHNNDYLICCLLQRYFQQMRNSALQIMVQAFGPPKKAQFPLSNFIDMLGFEDQEEAGTWCQYHGLAVDLDKDIIHLERSGFIQMPDNFPPKRRSLRLIESKRRSSISRVIANGQVDFNAALNHQPHISFDEHGYLHKEAWLAEDQNVRVPRQQSALPNYLCVEQSAPPPAYEPPKAALPPAHAAPPPAYAASPPAYAAPPHANAAPPPAYAAPPPAYVAPQPISAPQPNPAINQRLTVDLFNETFNRVIYEMAAVEVLSQIRQMKITNFSNYLRDQLLEEILSDMCLELAQEVLAKEVAEKRREELRRIEMERKRLLWSNQLLDGVVNDIVHEQIKVIGAETIRTAKEQKALALREEISRRLLSNVVDDVIYSECLELSTAVAKETITRRDSLMKEARRRVLHRRVCHCFQRWRRYAQRKIRRRTEKQTFPAGPSLLSYEQQVFALTSKGESRPATSVKRKSVLDLALNAKRLNALSEIHLNISNIEAELDAPLDLFSVLESALKLRLHNAKIHYWKMTIISLITDRRFNVGEQLRRWLGLQSAKLSSNGWIYTETKRQERPLTLSVTYTNDFRTCLTEGLKGANAILVVLDTRSGPQLEQQLQTLSQALSSDFDYFPPAVAFIDGNCENSGSAGVDQAIDSMEPCCHLCLDLTYPPPDRNLKLSRFLVAVVESTKCLWPIALETSTLWDLAHEFLLKKMSPSVYRDLKRRLSRGILHKPLSEIVHYHNHSVEQLAALLTDSHLCRIRWPPAELVSQKELGFPPVDWNAPRYQQAMANKLKRYLILPTWSDKDYDFPDACMAVRDYCSKVALPGVNGSCLLSRLNAILESCEAQFKEQLPEGVPQAENIPWTDVYQACIDYRLQALQAEDGTKQVTGYFSGVFDRIQDSQSWINASGWVALSEAVTLQETLEKSQLELQSRHIPSESEGAEAVLPRDVPEEIAELCDKIAENKRQAREENERFEALLNRALSPAEAVLPVSQRLKSSSARMSSNEFAASSQSNLIDRLELVEQTLNRSKRESRKFETYLLRALED